MRQEQRETVKCKCVDTGILEVQICGGRKWKKSYLLEQKDPLRRHGTLHVSFASFKGLCDASVLRTPLSYKGLISVFTTNSVSPGLLFSFSHQEVSGT